MHETHLIQPIIKGIAAHARRERASSVSRVRLKVGAFCAIKEDTFKQTFQILARGTVLEGAQLELTFFPGSTVEVISFDVAGSRRCTE